MRLLDGPAAGEFSTRRAPWLLRAVIGPLGAADVLDMPEDEPGADETIHVYEIVTGTFSQGFACFRGRGARGGAFATGDYRHLPEVDGEAVRERADWVAFARARLGEQEGVET